MRALAILVGLVGLTACDSNRHVDFSRAGAAQPVAEAKTTPVAQPVTAAVVAAAPVEDPRLHAILVDYRTEVESVLTAIWSKPVPTSDEAVVFTLTLDRILNINRKLRKQTSLKESDRAMLVEGDRILRDVRATLTVRP